MHRQTGEPKYLEEKPLLLPMSIFPEGIIVSQGRTILYDDNSANVDLLIKCLIILNVFLKGT